MNDFIDTVSINDEIGPHGLVIIKDQDGNILVKKHNMVVKGGKKIVFEKLMETEGFDSTKASNYKLYKLYFGDSMNETTFAYSDIDVIPDKNGDNGGEPYYSYSVATEGGIRSRGETADGHPYLEFNLASILCDPAKASYLSCLSITANKIINSGETTTDTGEVLFSRIKFDPIPMIEGNELTLLYYIYF